MQILELANKEGRLLAKRNSRWSAQIRENTWTITTAADQGVMNGTVVSDADFAYLLNDTMWNRTTTLPILGAVGSIDWQTLQAFPVTGPYQQYMLRGKNLFIDPAPTSADTGAFDYMSTSWCESSGGTGQKAWAADTDVGLLDEELMQLGIIWRWLARKGLNYAEDFAVYEAAVLDSIARDGGKPKLALNGGIRHRVPGVMVPLGSWSI